MLSVRCEACQQDYLVQEHYRGQQVKCPRGHILTVPEIVAYGGAPTAELSMALGRFAARLATPFGIVFYVIALVSLVGGMVAAAFVADISGGGALMVVLYSVLGSFFIFSQGLTSHMLGAAARFATARRQ